MNINTHQISNQLPMQKPVTQHASYPTTASAGHVLRAFTMAVGLAALLPTVALSAVPVTWSSKDCVALDATCTPGLALVFDNGLEGANDVPTLAESDAHPFYRYTPNGTGILERSATHSREGNYSVRSRLAKNDLLNYRQELKIKGSNTGSNVDINGITQAGSHDYWFGVSIYVPSSSSISSNSVLLQWHLNNRDDFNRSPVIGLRITGGVWYMTREVGTWSGATLGPVAINEWTDWVLRVRWRADKTGLIEVWKNGTRVVGGASWTNIQTGASTDWNIPFVKFGRYSAALGGSSEPNGTVHESYHDAIRICYAPTCTYNDVAPRGGRLTAK